MPQFDWINQQGSAGWYKARLGLPTASCFDQIMTPKTGKPSESRKKYACRLIAERLMNWQADDLSKIAHIAAGKENEPIAVAKMELVFDIQTQPIGFVKTNDGRFGASPDRVGNVAADRQHVGAVVEVKSPTIPTQMERLIFGDNEAYRCQRQGQLWVAEADKAYFFSFNARTPDYLIEDGRDEAFLRKLTDCLERFSDELEEWTAKARSLGPWQSYPDLVPPVDAAYGREMRSMPEYSEAEVAYILGEDR
jgi:hypothetical protein